MKSNLLKRLARRAAGFILAAACLLAASPASLAAAGDSSDPLVSVSYVLGSYIPGLMQRLDELIASRARDGAEPSGLRHQAVSALGSVTLGEGSVVILLDGAARFSVERGTVVDATSGAEITGVALAARRRYIVCEDSAVSVSILQDSHLALSGTAEVRQGPGRVSPFSDVKHGAWYFDDVVSAYDRGLVSGMTATTFEPQGTLTGAQAVKLAACMHQLYYDGAVTLKNSDTGPWYRSYADYAVKNRIIYFELADYNATVTRREFVKIFYRALPPGAFNERNDIPDGAIPDVSIYDDGAEQVYAFYRAGILTGYTGTAGFAEHAFGADTTVTRAEVATIMNRMFDADARADFTIG